MYQFDEIGVRKSLGVHIFTEKLSWMRRECLKNSVKS